MGFKHLKDWITRSKDGGVEKAGEIAVTNDGEAVIVFDFEPSVAEAYFIDPEPPIDPCNPHPEDTIDVSVEYIGYNRWGLKIKWDVFSVRKVKYDIKK